MRNRVLSDADAAAKPENYLEPQMPDELIATALYCGVMGIGLLWVFLRMMRYVRRVRAQNAAEALWMQTVTIHDANRQPLPADNPGTGGNPTNGDKTQAEQTDQAQ